MTRPFSSAGKGEKGRGKERRGGGEGPGAPHSNLVGQALSQLFTLLSECYDNNAIRTGMNMFMSACADII